MFPTVLVTTGKIQNQPKCPSMEEWIKQIWYIYTMKYYSAIKANEILSFATTWMELEDIMLSEISQAWTDKLHIFLLICGRQKLKQLNSWRKRVEWWLPEAGKDSGEGGKQEWLIGTITWLGRMEKI